MSETTNASPLRILQLTDTHLFADPQGTLHDCNTEDSLRTVLAAARMDASPTDLVLLTGDLTHDGSAQGYRRLGRLVQQTFEVPVWCLPGNHDDGDTLRAALDDDSLCCPGGGVVGDWQLVLLDSTLPGREGGHLAAAELDRLENVLQARRAPHALVCLHHNPVPMGSRWLDTMTVDNGDALFSVLGRHPQVRVVLWGHVHQPFDTERHHIRLLASPSTCVQFLPGSDSFAVDSRPPGYRRLTLHANGRVETTVCYVDAGLRLSGC
ncbi:MAG: 3',5'-cyclic-AMP phosphodiesterase [Gammaproteobacteria bacterium]